MEDTQARVRFECSEPILCVENMQASLQFYVNGLGFQNAPWGSKEFTHVSRDRAGIYLCKSGQGSGGAWPGSAWKTSKGFTRNTKARGVVIRMAPTNYPWALEMHIEDSHGNVLRLGSEPK